MRYLLFSIISILLSSQIIGGEIPGTTENSLEEVLKPVIDGKSLFVDLKGKTYKTDKRIALKNLKNVLIEGNGAKILMSSQDHIFKIEDCSNLSIRNLTLDYDPMIFTQARITKVDPEASIIEFEIEKGYPDLEAKLIARESIDVFTAEGAFRHDIARIAGKPEIIDPRHGRMQLSVSEGKTVNPGDRIPIGRRFANVIQTVGCDKTLFENLTIHSSGCFAIGIRFSGGDDRINSVRVIPGPRPDGAETDRLRSTNGDGFNISFSRDYPVITNCEVTRTNDDSINYHAGEIMPLYDGTSDGLHFKTMRPFNEMHDRIPKIFMPDDKVLILKKGNYQILGEAVIKSVSINKDSPSIEALAEYFDRAGSPGAASRYQPTSYDIEFKSSDIKLENGMFFQMIPSGRPFLIANNYFHDHRARGMRIMVPNGEISGNRLERITHAGVSLGPEFAYWNEAGWVSSLTVQNNSFKDVGMGALALNDSYVCGVISTFAALPRGIRTAPDNRGIVIRNNRIENSAGAAFFISAAEDLTLTDNIVENTANTSSNPGSAWGFHGLAPIWIFDSRNIQGHNMIDGKYSKIK